MMKTWMTGLRGFLLDLLFPPDVCCLCCGHALGDTHTDGLCPTCLAALEALEAKQQANVSDESLPPGVDAVFAAYPYTAQARTLILKLKFEYVRSAAVPLGRAMAFLPGGEADLLVPVPTTRLRKRERGFNQAALLCEVIARETGMPMLEALTRKSEQTAQTRLSGQSRRTNLEGCMQADARVSGQRIVLVDDVYTTGATAREAARALREAGAMHVSVFAAARSLDQKEKRSTRALPFDLKKPAVH